MRMSTDTKGGGLQRADSGSSRPGLGARGPRGGARAAFMIFIAVCAPLAAAHSIHPTHRSPAPDIDLTSVVEKVRHHVQGSGDRLWVDADGYRVVITGEGLRFEPVDRGSRLRAESRERRGIDLGLRLSGKTMSAAPSPWTAHLNAAERS